ncbi:MAG: hypothetical protein AAF228_01255 [Pseudomonadota bacterium]
MRFFSNICDDYLFASDKQVESFDHFITMYFDYLDSHRHTSGCIKEEYQVRLIASSPESAVARALAKRTEEFYARDIRIKAIFANLISADALSTWIEGETALTKGVLTENLRWAKKPSLLEAHEQLVLGVTMCWSGDTMRRQTDRRYVMDLFKHDAPNETRLANSAFDAIWAASIPVSKTQVKKMAQSRDFNAALETDTLLTELWPSHLHTSISTRH